jgi:hypothetical protein
VDDRVRRDDQPAGPVGAGHGCEPASCGQPAQLADELRALVSDQPGRQRAVRLGAGTAVDGEPRLAVLDEQPGRGVARRVHRPDAEERKQCGPRARLARRAFRNGPRPVHRGQDLLMAIFLAPSRFGSGTRISALEEQRNGEWRYLEFLQVTSLITADIFMREIPGGTRGQISVPPS